MSRMIIDEASKTHHQKLQEARHKLPYHLPVRTIFEEAPPNAPKYVLRVGSCFWHHPEVKTISVKISSWPELWAQIRELEGVGCVLVDLASGFSEDVMQKLRDHAATAQPYDPEKRVGCMYLGHFELGGAIRIVNLAAHPKMPLGNLPIIETCA